MDTGTIIHFIQNQSNQRGWWDGSLMVTLTASPHDVLPPSWDESIVPSLRKRLESESRILTKRLSTISITDEGPPPDPQQHASRTVSPPQNRADDSSASTGSYPLRPSAIPRPSYSRGERAAGPLSPPAEQSRKATSKRQRTQSTPFPFDPAPSTSTLPKGKTANGMQSPNAASGSTSPRVQSPSLGRTTPTPSRIPTVSSRMRSGSQSSQGFGSLNGGKATLPPSHKLSPSETVETISMDSGTQYGSLRVNDSSSNLSRQRIVDERPPFANEPPSKVSEATGRPSSDEERPYQHWYRGDVSRNGGVGEYRVGKRMEMLDIANYGHTLRKPAGRARPHEEPTPHSEKTNVVPRKRAESVSSMERASIYIDPEDDTVTGRVLDEMPLTDVETEEYEQEHYLYNPRSDFGFHHDQSQTSYNNTPPAAGSSSSLSSRIPSLKSQTRLPQPQPRPNTPKIPNAFPPAVASEPSTSAKGDHAERGRAPAPANSQTKPPSKTKGQKRSKSAADALRGRPNAHESAEYAGLADAVPDTRSPLPRDGNWDEVILPTVARRMGIEYEKEDPVVAAKRATRVSRVAPAPGTFGYDHTKYKPPMSDEEIPLGEFGQDETAQQFPQVQNVSDPGPTSADNSLIMRSRRETMPSSPPFSQYAPHEEDMEVPLPNLRRADHYVERKDVPRITVSPPTSDGRKDEHKPGTGCCGGGCVVM